MCHFTFHVHDNHLKLYRILPIHLDLGPINVYKFDPIT